MELPSGMAGAAWRASVKSARAFAFIVQSQCFSVSSAIGLITPVAAFETSTFSAPAASMISRALSGSPRLPRRTSASAPAARISSAVASAALSFRR